jgi:hypothetical protein
LWIEEQEVGRGILKGRNTGVWIQVPAFKLRSLIHLELILVQGGRQDSSFSLLHVDTQFSQHHLLKRLFFLQVCFGLFCQKSNEYNCVDWFLWMFLCQHHAVLSLSLCSITWSQVLEHLQYCYFAQNAFAI